MGVTSSRSGIGISKTKWDRRANIGMGHRKPLHQNALSRWLGATWAAVVVMLMFAFWLHVSDSDGSPDLSGIQSMERPLLHVSELEGPSAGGARSPPIARSDCGKSWDSTRLATLRDRVSDSGGVLTWSVTGGAEYRKHAIGILQHWERAHISNVLIVTLDQESADVICDHGYAAVVYDRPKASYSIVADAKFQVAKDLAAAGIDALFMEMDIFCRASPLPAMTEATIDAQSQRHDVVVIGHADVPEIPNIGMYFVRASNRTAFFFQRLIELLAPSKGNLTYKDERRWTITYFDQRFFYHCAYRINTTVLGEEPPNPCQHVNITTTVMKNRIISSHEPPLITDSTVCIHPLQAKPMMPFINKVVTAASMGFDIHPEDPNERFLKTASGLLDYCEVHTQHTLPFKKWPVPSSNQKERVVFHIAALVALAKVSNRTLVLPREMVTRETHSVPLYGVVDISTINDLVSWRWDMPDSIGESNRVMPVESRRTLVSIEPDDETQHTFEFLQSQLLALPDGGGGTHNEERRVVEIDNLLLLRGFHPRSGWSSTSKLNGAIVEVLKTLKWCLQRQFNYHGGRQGLCDHTKSTVFYLSFEND